MGKKRAGKRENERLGVGQLEKRYMWVRDKGKEKINGSKKAIDNKYFTKE
jgi:hypothetical protein